VLVPLLLLLVAAGGYGVVALRGAMAAAQQRSRLLADVDALLAAPAVDADGLSRLMSALQKFPDHATARDLLAARARLELARDRPERAQQAFLSLAVQPGATAAEQSLGARILLRLHEAGAPDPGTAAGWLAQAMELAAAAASATADPGDLLRAWQAAERAGRSERAAGFARQLAEQHADSPAAAFVAFAVAFDERTTAAGVDAAVAGLVPPPVEAIPLRAFALLQAGDLAGAVAAAEDGLRRAPGVGVVRWAAAAVFHTCAAASPENSSERARWAARRDPQLDWVLAQPGLDASRARQCAAMREVR
jgi:hypothetical protein